MAIIKPKLKPQAPTVTTSRTGQGITVQEAVSGRTIYEQAKAAREHSSEAVSILQEMQQPTQAENKTLAEVKQLLTAIMRQTRDDGRKAFLNRVEEFRATRCLASIDIGPLLDRLNPERVYGRILREAEKKIERERSRAPFANPDMRNAAAMARAAKRKLYAPMEKAQDNLARAIQQNGKAQDGYRWWKPSSWAELRTTSLELASAHEELIVATPRPSKVDDAAYFATMRAESNQRDYMVWYRGEGRKLDREEKLLQGIGVAIEDGDIEMRKLVAEGNLKEAMERQAEHDAARSAIEFTSANEVQTSGPGLAPRM